MMREVGLAIGAMLVLVVIGTHVWGGPIPRLWARTLAHECKADAPPQHCVATTDARVTDRWDDFGRTVPEAQLTLTAPDHGRLYAFVPTTDTDRLAITGNETVRVTVLDGEVLTVTGPNGETATANPNFDPQEAALRFLVVSAASILAVTVAGLLWRRRRGGVLWPRPAAASTAAGAVVGLGATNLVARDLAMPVLFGGTAVASLVLAYVCVVHLRPALMK